MIPTLIVFGLVFGRWWRLSLAVAAVGWPAALVAGDVMELEVGLVGAAGVAVLTPESGCWFIMPFGRRSGGSALGSVPTLLPTPDRSAGFAVRRYEGRRPTRR